MTDSLTYQRMGTDAPPMNLIGPPCSRRACTPVARSDSTSVTASEPCDRG
jgi:hypothetical protein